MPECRFNKSSAPPSSLAMNVTIIVVRRVNIDRSILFRAAQTEEEEEEEEEESLICDENSEAFAN